MKSEASRPVVLKRYSIRIFQSHARSYRREKEQELVQKQAVQQAEEQKRGAQRRAEVLQFLQAVRPSFFFHPFSVFFATAVLLYDPVFLSVEITPVISLPSSPPWLT